MENPSEREPDSAVEKMPDAESELARFREQWRAEVARSKKEDGNSKAETAQNQLRRRKEEVQQTSGRRKDVVDYSEDFAPRTYHDLAEPEEQLRLGKEGKRADRPSHEPTSALEHYERAVERETQGNLGDSLNLYRKAFKVGLLSFFIVYTSRQLLR